MNDKQARQFTQSVNEMKPFVILISTKGDNVVYSRRLNALKLIQTCHPISSLKSLLDKKELPFAHIRIDHELNANLIEELSQLNRDQRLAFELIVNNINAVFLVIGPPGSGKTKLINLIQKALSDKIANEKILISSFQHEAVDNVLDKLTNNGLPIPKFDNKYSSERISSWANSLVEQLENKCNELCLRNQHILCFDKLSHELNEFEYSKVCIENIKQLVTLVSDFDLIDLADSLEKQFKTDNIFRLGFEKELIRLIRNLRIEPFSYFDDGYKNIIELFVYLNNSSGLKYLEALCDISYLAQITLDHEANSLDFEKITTLKNNLLTVLIDTTNPLYRAPISERALKIKKQLQRHLEYLENSDLEYLEYFSLKRFIQDIKDALAKNTLGTLVAEYSKTIGATCSYSASKSIANSFLNNKIQYDTVIIDEASRANPLDLLIPMSQATKRIVLIGDDKQLPHILDEGIANKVNEESKFEQDYFKESLFKRLKDSMPAQYVVTLHTQYRMHPILGDFVSKNFYDETLQSGKTEQDFELNIPGYENKVCVFYHVNGEDERFKTAYYNTAEIDKVIEILQSLQHTNETIGVITFYKKQSEEINTKIQKLNLINLERIKVGTVDSFQGREYDIVILSLVRSNPNRDIGFLNVKNRLNVAFSRQKKLLITVGNINMYNNSIIEKRAPSLYNLVQLCRGNNYAQIY